MVVVPAWVVTAQSEGSAANCQLYRAIPKEEVLYVFAADGLNDIIRWCTQELCDDGELVDVVLARKKWLSFKHLREYASCAPYIYLYIIFLPCEHYLWGTIVSCRDVASHLRVLNTGETKITNFQVAVLVDKNIARL